jgi:hypothetical protein
VAGGTTPKEPDSQKEFCTLVTEYMNAQTAYTRETNPIRKAAMKQPNPQAEEAPGESYLWTGKSIRQLGRNTSVFCLPDIRRSAFHSRLRRRPTALSLAAASSSNIRATVIAQVVPFSGLTKLNNILGERVNPAFSCRASFLESCSVCPL